MAGDELTVVRAGLTEARALWNMRVHDDSSPGRCVFFRSRGDEPTVSLQVSDDPRAVSHSLELGDLTLGQPHEAWVLFRALAGAPLAEVRLDASRL
jgi:hypothetical protein